MVESEERLYTIGDVAEMTGVPVKTIRYYAEIGLLPPARTTQARYLLYAAAQIWRLELVRTLRHIGFSLEEIRRIVTGETGVAAALDWQIAAVEAQIGHLTRLRDLLREARAADPGDERSLSFVHDIGTAVTRGAQERERLLAERFGAALGGEAVPAGWVESMLANASGRLPEWPTPEQAAAWAELIALLGDAEFSAAMSAQLASFWQAMRSGRIERGRWQAEMAYIGTAALAALRAGEMPDGETVRALARVWAGLFAEAAGVPCDEAFLRELAARAPGFMDARSRRVWELLERAGWRDDVPSQLRAQHLLLDGLTALVNDLGNPK